MSAGTDGDEEKTTLQIAATVQVPKAVVGQPDAQEKERRTKHDKLMLAVQAVIAVVGIGALIVAICGLRMTRDTFRTGRRAWLLRGDQINLTPNAPQPDQPWIAEIFVKNVGESPALEVVATHRYLHIGGTIHRIPDDPHEWDKYSTATTLQAPTEEAPSRALLGPRQRKRAIVPMPTLSGDEIDRIGRKEVALYIVSWVVYRDIFKRQGRTVECSRLLLNPRRMVDCGAEGANRLE